MARILENKLAIVTGSSRGIGAAIAENLAAKGCNLVLTYTSDSSTGPIQQLSDRLAAEHGIRTLVVQADIGSPTGPRAIVEAAVGHFLPPSDGGGGGGGGDGGDGGDGARLFQIDIVVNNAGISRASPLSDVSVDDFHDMYAVNVLGPLLLVHAVLPHLPRDRSGRIVNVSSVSATLGLVGQSVYGGTKAALDAMTRTWARELAERCTVNSINPGPVEGPMYARETDEFKKVHMGPFNEHTPLARVRPGPGDARLEAELGVPGRRSAYCSEIAGIVGMLCTEDAGWCTGQVVSANGGMIMA